MRIDSLYKKYIQEISVFEEKALMSQTQFIISIR